MPATVVYGDDREPANSTVAWPKEIEKAVQRKIAFEAHPRRHIFTPPDD